MKDAISPLLTISENSTKQFEEVGSRFQTTYFEFVYRAPRRIVLSEMSDEELLKLAYESGNFAYLEDPDEDVYSLSDGTPI